jgi:hypothetical protein
VNAREPSFAVFERARAKIDRRIGLRIDNLDLGLALGTLETSARSTAPCSARRWSATAMTAPLRSPSSPFASRSPTSDADDATALDVSDRHAVQQHDRSAGLTAKSDALHGIGSTPGVDFDEQSLRRLVGLLKSC